MMMDESGAAIVEAGNSITFRDKGGDLFRVREYQPADSDLLQSFYEGFEPKRAAQGLPPGDSVRIRAWLTSILATGHHLLAFSGADLVGHAFVVPTGRPGIGEYAVFLRQDLRGRGAGTELSRAAVDAARRAGYAGLWLSVEPVNRAAVRSYEKVGFRYVPKTIFSIEAEMELTL